MTGARSRAFLACTWLIFAFQLCLTGTAHGQNPPSPELRFPRPENIRGIYVNAWAAGNSERLDRLIRLAQKTEINTFVVDVKDILGCVSYKSQIPLVRHAGADAVVRIPNIARVLQKLEAAGIYPVARVTAFKDPKLAKHRRDLMLRTVDGRRRSLYTNPYLDEVHLYLLAIADEAADFGFPAIQWDYVRFPVTRLAHPNQKKNNYIGSAGRPKWQAIQAFLLKSKVHFNARGVAVQADVFAQSMLEREDVGIGQNWDALLSSVNQLVPMMYPSHYAPGALGFKNPNGRPRAVIRRSLTLALRRRANLPGAATVIPFLQAFTQGDPPYTPKEIRSQIQGAKDAGIREWYLWHPGSQYRRAAFRQRAPADPKAQKTEP